MMSRIGKEHPHHNHHSHIQHVPHMEVPPATSMMAGTADVDVTVVAALVGRSLRPHSTPATLVWLEENYEIAQGVCVPRNTLYVHYVDFCAKNGMTPVNAASFGKVCHFYTSSSLPPSIFTTGKLLWRRPVLIPVFNFGLYSFVSKKHKNKLQLFKRSPH